MEVTLVCIRCRSNGMLETLTSEHGSHLAEGDMQDVMTFHDDPLVITPVFQRSDNNSVRLHRVLVHTGASINILYWNAFTDLGLFQTDLLPSKAPIYPRL